MTNLLVKETPFMPLFLRAFSLSIDALIFDMDGLLVDSEPIALIAWQKVLRPYGATFTETDIKAFLGVPTIDTATHIVERFNLSLTASELVSARREIMQHEILQSLHPMPGAVELVHWLDNQRIPIVLATSSIASHAQLCLEKVGLLDAFPLRVTSDQVTRGKPFPDVFLQAASMLNVPLQHCLILEDAPLGVAAANAAGIPVISVPNKYTRELSFPPVLACAASLNEVMGWLME
jgi:HAD superfamily hydrolase (TIGR01509 family)